VKTGVDYWLRRLRPYAAEGFGHGVVTGASVILYREDGAQVVLPRPRAWLSGTALDAALEEMREEPDPEVVADFAALRRLEPGDVE
jgi:hypothetical protein